MRVEYFSRRGMGQGLSGGPRQCTTKGCTHAASCHVVLLGTEYIRLCSRCRRVWEETYDRALFGWPETA